MHTNGISSLTRQNQHPATTPLLLAALIIITVSSHPATAATVIVDNTDSGFTTASGVWYSSTAPGHWLTDYVTQNTSDLSGQAEWRPDIPAADQYQVSVWIPATTQDRPNNAKYTVAHASGSADVYIDQSNFEVQWVTLGTYSFDAGTSATVTLNSTAEANTLIVADAVKFTTGPQAEPEFRAFWASTGHEGLGSLDQIDDMVSRALQGNYNVINALIMYKQDNSSTLSGALWNSSILPKAAAYAPDEDPLGHLIERAHANGLQVHGRLIPYIVSPNWPPTGNPILTDNTDWYCVLSGNMGDGPSKVSGFYHLDPGSPEVQEYIISIVRELITNYEIDGIHWDFIRHLSTDSGYPADVNYADSSLARFRTLTGRSDIPPSGGDEDWNDFRRRTVDEVVRRSRAEVAAAKSNPSQPISVTAAVAGWGSAVSDFQNTSAYRGVFQNWEKWMRLGWMDGACPMIYLSDHVTSQQNLQRAWVDLAIGWRYDRHMHIGQCLYKNNMANSIVQMQYAYDQGAEGTINFAYGATADNDFDGVAEKDWTWYPYVSDNLFHEPAPIPELTWRTPAATEGTLWGQIIDTATGEPVDNAEVTVGSLDPVLTDPNGYYVVTLMPASSAGTNYSAAATHSGYLAETSSAAVVAGDITRLDLSFDTVLPPVITAVVSGPEVVLVGRSHDQQLTLEQGTANPWTLIEGPTGATISARGLVSGWTASQEEVGQTLNFTARAENSAGSDEVTWQVQVQEPPPCEEVMLTDFEGYANGSTVLFRYPRYSGSTPDNLEATPNVSQVTDEIPAFSGTSCCKVQWQFVDTDPARWMRLTTNNATNVPNPTIALDRPVRIRMRVDEGRFRLCIGVRESGTTADYGEDGGTSGTIEWIGANSIVGEAPSGAPQGTLIEPMPGVWQTIVFNPATDPILAMTGDGILSSLIDRGTLEHLAFAAVDTVGPFTVYIDNVESLCDWSLPPAVELIYESRDADGNITPAPTYNEYGSWLDSTAKSEIEELTGNGSRFVNYELPNTGTDNATFIPQIETPGLYELFATWPNGADCYDARYTINHHQGQTVHLMDQISTGATEQPNTNQWISLGQYWFAAGQNVEAASVNVSEETVSGKPGTSWGRRVYADAIKLTLVESWPNGDYTGDGRVNLSDFAYLYDCIAGPAGAYTTPACKLFDLDLDNDIDLIDFAGFQRAVNIAKTPIIQ